MPATAARTSSTARCCRTMPYEPGFAAFAQPSGLASDGKLLYRGRQRRQLDPRRAVRRQREGDDRGRHGRGCRRAGCSPSATSTARDAASACSIALDVLFHDGKLYVADTYNNKIKVIDPEQDDAAARWPAPARAGAEDMPAAFDEPAGLAYAGGKLYVADTNNHAIRTIDLKRRQPGSDAGDQGADGAGTAAKHSARLDLSRRRRGRRAAAASSRPMASRVARGAGHCPRDTRSIPTRRCATWSRPWPTGPICRDALGKLTDAPERAATFDIDLPAAIIPTPTGSTCRWRTTIARRVGRGVQGRHVIWTVPVRCGRRHGNGRAADVQG